MFLKLVLNVLLVSAVHGAEIAYYDCWAIHGPENEYIAELPVAQKFKHTTLSL